MKMLNTTTTNDTVLSDKKTSLATAITTACVLPLCILTFVLNLLALVVLKRTKKFHKNKFYCLILCLSFSDMVFSVTCFAIVFEVFLKALGLYVPYLCFVGLLATSIAITFSWIQVLFVCIERLLATLNLDKMQNWKMKYALLYSLSFVVTVIFVISLFIAFSDNPTPAKCGLQHVFETQYAKFQIIRSFVHLVLYFSIVSIYLDVIRRLRNRMRQVGTTNGTTVVNLIDVNKTHNTTKVVQFRKNNKWKYEQGNVCIGQRRTSLVQCRKSSGQCSRTLGENNETFGQRRRTSSNFGLDLGQCTSNATKNDLQRKTNSPQHRQNDLQRTTNFPSHRVLFFRRSISTVGIVILFASIGMLPSVITNAVSGITNGHVISSELTDLTNTLVFINPLFNPLIYVLRINEFRSMLKCNC